MLHYILVAWAAQAQEKQALSTAAQALLCKAEGLPGVKQVRFHHAIISGENRSDLMICIELEPQALPVFDKSDIHQKWKSDFGPHIRQKTIFDCE